MTEKIDFVNLASKSSDEIDALLVSRINDKNELIRARAEVSVALNELETEKRTVRRSLLDLDEKIAKLKHEQGRARDAESIAINDIKTLERLYWRARGK